MTAISWEARFRLVVVLVAYSWAARQPGSPLALPGFLPVQSFPAEVVGPVY